MSTTFKSSPADSKRHHHSHHPKLPDQYRSQVQQLRELFPGWSNDDLLSTLQEAGGDTALAATRISEGHAEQWGAVTRKKDKKSPVQTKDSAFPRERGDFRAGRGGRGGRGGPGRGGAAGGRSHSARGAHRDSPRTHAPSGAPASPPTNGDSHTSESWAEQPAATSAESGPSWGSTSETQAGAPSASGWTNTDSTWGANTTTNGSVTASPVVKQQPIPASRPVANTPANSGRSWAQIARPAEKPPTPAVSTTHQTATLPPVPPAPLEPPREPTPPPAPAQETEPTTESQTGWEEPTTVQSPPWEDELQSKPLAPADDTWETTAAEEIQVHDEVKPISTEAPAPEPAPEPIAVSLPAPQAKEAVGGSGLSEAIPKHVAPIHPRPSSAAHRHSARFKTDQAVTLPNNFGSGLEKVGMQFGSLSIGGDEIVDSKLEPVAPPAPEPVAKPPIESPVVPEPQRAPSAPAPPQPEPPVTSPPITASLGSTPSFTQQSQPQAIPQQAQTQASAPPPPAPSHLPTSVSQPTLSTPSAAPQLSSPMSSYPHQSQQSQQSQQPQPQPQQQVTPPSLNNHQQSLQHHQYAQHGVPTHLDPSQAQHQSPLPQQQVPSSFYRQPETQTPYYHAGAGTPPTAQAQDSSYGAFGQLGQQGPVSQLAGFGGAAEYGYADSQQRNFYDSYGQQQTGGFGTRSGLHDDVKGLSALQQQQQQQQQQPQQPQQQQGGPAPPPGSAQQGGQGYPPPMGYYQPYPQNQYYGNPYNYAAYGVPQPFVKYPVFPPGPGSAPSPAGPPGKQPQSYGQGQAQNLYGQQHQQAYEEPQLGYHPHAHSHSHQLSGSLGGVGVLPGGAADYGKQLYAHQHQQGLGARGAATSPETAFKPYAQGGAGAKDVGGVGSGGSGGPQGRGGAPAQAGAFYGAGAGRFAQGPGAQAQGGGPGQAQQAQGGPAAHLGYPQGASDGAFYSAYGPAAAQQGRQQGYWQ